jgi:hypothetical protein
MKSIVVSLFKHRLACTIGTSLIACFPHMAVARTHRGSKPRLRISSLIACLHNSSL